MGRRTRTSPLTQHQWLVHPGLNFTMARLERAAAMLVSGGPNDPAPVPDPAFGVVTLHEWTEISLRHAELHMSFFVVRGVRE